MLGAVLEARDTRGNKRGVAGLWDKETEVRKERIYLAHS